MKMPKINAWTVVAIGGSILAAVAGGIGDSKRKEEMFREETRSYLDKNGNKFIEEETKETESE